MTNAAQRRLLACKGLELTELLTKEATDRPMTTSFAGAYFELYASWSALEAGSQTILSRSVLAREMIQLWRSTLFLDERPAEARAEILAATGQAVKDVYKTSRSKYKKFLRELARTHSFTAEEEQQFVDRRSPAPLPAAPEEIARLARLRPVNPRTMSQFAAENPFSAYDPDERTRRLEFASVLSHTAAHPTLESLMRFAYFDQTFVRVANDVRTLPENRYYEEDIIDVIQRELLIGTSSLLGRTVLDTELDPKTLGTASKNTLLELLGNNPDAKGVQQITKRGRAALAKVARPDNATLDFPALLVRTVINRSARLTADATFCAKYSTGLAFLVLAKASMETAALLVCLSAEYERTVGDLVAAEVNQGPIQGRGRTCFPWWHLPNSPPLDFDGPGRNLAIDMLFTRASAGAHEVSGELGDLQMRQLQYDYYPRLALAVDPDRAIISATYSASDDVILQALAPFARDPDWAYGANIAAGMVAYRANSVLVGGMPERSIRRQHAHRGSRPLP